jgi:hypothetical protein
MWKERGVSEKMRATQTDMMEIHFDYRRAAREAMAKKARVWPFGFVRAKRVIDLMAKAMDDAKWAETKAVQKTKLYEECAESVHDAFVRVRSLEKENAELKAQLTGKEAQYADAVSRWAGLARLWQEEHGGGLVYVKETADGGVQVWDEAVGDGCEPSAVIELKPIGKAVADRVYVTSEERKEDNENVALEAAAVSAGCAAEGTETGADRDPAELAGQGNTGTSAGEQGDGIPKG